ncbi:MAG: hypothetical protein H6861_00350 [Rhodospirillales bacterium]|nr:hypothetical protein [Rhodospirillales bacterium]
MTVIPCERNPKLKEQIDEYAEILKVEAHKLGNHGLSETDFYQGGVFRGAIERIRGQFSATMREKRVFVRHILNYMQDKGFISEWESAGESNRHDYKVVMPSGKVSVIELKGCLDGNNTTIFERPPHAQEFIIWSVCSNAAADPRHNAWSGIHTRLSPEIIEGGKLVDGIMIWDWLCGTIARPCPKLTISPSRTTSVGPYTLPPPCIYLLPGTIPSPRNNPHPAPHKLEEVELLQAFHSCFGGTNQEINFVDFEVGHRGSETVRRTSIMRDGEPQKVSEDIAIRRS